MVMNEARTRPLVFRNACDLKGARHPFRRALPLEVLVHMEEQISVEQAAAKRPKAFINEDLSLFVLSFSAFFTAFYAFIF